MKSKLISTTWKPIALAFAVALSFSSAAQAAIQLDFVYNSTTDTTTASYAGTWDVTSNATFAGFTLRNSSNSQFLNVSGAQVGFFGGSAFTGSIPWVNSFNAVTGSGDIFGFQASGSIFGPAGFTPSTVLNGSMIYATGVDLADLGFAPDVFSGTIVGSAGTINWTTNGAAIPEPSTYALLAGGFALVAVMARRRRTA